MIKNMNVLLIIVVTLCLCSVIACVETVRTPPIKYHGPQPPEAILEVFAGISRTGITNPSTERGKQLNEKYPPSEWIQMLLNKSVIIEDSGDFSGYMSIRKYLDERRAKPEMRRLYGVQYNDWESYKSAYIDRKIWEYKQLKLQGRKTLT